LESSDDDNDDGTLNIITNTLTNNIQKPPVIPALEKNILKEIGSTQSTHNNFFENKDCNLQKIVYESLRNWATNFNIPQNALNALLKTLKYDAGLSFLPKDTRSLLKCNSTKITNLRNVEPKGGFYYHFSLSAGIIKCSSIFALPDIIKIAVGVDGLPLSKNSLSQFWRILAYIK